MVTIVGSRKAGLRDFLHKATGPDLHPALPLRTSLKISSTRCGAADSRPLHTRNTALLHRNDALTIAEPAIPASPQNWGQTVNPMKCPPRTRFVGFPVFQNSRKAMAVTAPHWTGLFAADEVAGDENSPAP